MNSLKSLLVGAATIRIVLGQFCEHQWSGKFAAHDVDGVPYLRARQNTPAPPLEIQPLIVSGPTSNRVNFLFLGDGCTYAV